ncbi:MAG TPA: flagellar motor switch protein FliN [Bryobacteraceae bacterium]|nr:flagellar motor switch protein FliN [Bryobacteraceae bacterium]
MARGAGGFGMMRPAQVRIGAYAGQALCDALARAMERVYEAGMVSEADGAEAVEDAIVWRQPVSLAEGACLWLIAGRELWEPLGRAAWDAVAAQTMAGIATALAEETGRDVRAEGGGIEGGELDADLAAAVFEIRGGDQVWQARIAWNAEFAAAWPMGSAGVSDGAGGEPGGSKTLDLLMDVALPVSVSFGKTLLQIREVLKLNTGSVVELDRLISEPVEVIVNNCVIARGEVVVVDGNYGVRVTQLASRAERMRLAAE